MTSRIHHPLLVTSDRMIRVEVNHPAYHEVRKQLVRFAERVKSPSNLHTYRMTPYTLWNAAVQNLTPGDILEWLEKMSKLPVPSSVATEVKEWMGRYGMLRLERVDSSSFQLISVQPEYIQKIMDQTAIREWSIERPGENALLFPLQARGQVKQACTQAGYPVIDQIGFQEGESLSIRLSKHSRTGAFTLRDYQKQAVEAFGGNGVIVLPCGAGKTVVGIAAMEKVGKATLILTPNATSAKQWIREILDKTDLPEEAVGEYTSECKKVRPVTVTTYQMMTRRTDRNGPFHHMKLFSERDWGLIIYDEVHLLPAPVFRATAALQAKRRLGLTATLIREDGKEGEVFSLIGPKLFEVSWGELEDQGWIAEAVCTEIRVPFSDPERERYTRSSHRQKYRLAAENPNKMKVIDQLIRRHRGEQILVIGQYLDQLQQLAERYQAPIITGQMKQEKRESWFERFRNKEISLLIVSKVANFAVDLPDAAVAIQISGTFGSRQEEAQRLGRILRPKAGDNRAYFYHVVTKDTLDQEYAMNRQLFLAEQGYSYQIHEM
ncbi:DNA repair helicase XPB [Lihuaxuella thermophila]|uniref:DNA 3'-5' helicase n=1 Tax=Lihuaxuella thermophila TaxID=1173111 RepID=A0A1H8AL71_9BACL|nr:DNA repair helicase XPB [Lihuaxuella thermophila]SEM71490.1 DNA excision repair protein ERCC-3 [Lihuaxuella thermophila]